MIDEDPAGAPPGGEEPGETEQIRGDIAETREELGETVEALAQKADVKAQVSEKRDEAKATLRAKLEGVQSKVAESPQAKQAAECPQLAIGAAALAALLLLLILRTRRS